MVPEVAQYSDDLKGLARQCPQCNIIAHYEIKGRKPADVVCPDCDFEFTVQKYKRGERPKAINTYYGDCEGQV